MLGVGGQPLESMPYLGTRRLGTSGDLVLWARRPGCRGRLPSPRQPGAGGGACSRRRRRDQQEATVGVADGVDGGGNGRPTLTLTTRKFRESELFHELRGCEAFNDTLCSRPSTR